MKNMTRVLLGVFVVSAMCVGVAQAQDSGGYEVIVDIPSTSSVKFTATAVRGDNEAWDEDPSDALDFGELDFENGVFVPDLYYAIDLGTTGVGQPTQITFSYSETPANPNEGTGRGGLGSKATMTVNRAVWFEPGTPTPPPELTIVAKRTLASVNTGMSPLLSSSFEGGWPRIYVAINTDEAFGEVFNNLDAPGQYVGLFTISAVAQ